MRSATMIVARATFLVVTIGMCVGHAFLMRRDFPVLVSMGQVRHSQHGQTSQPKEAQTLRREHKAKAKPGVGPVKSGRKVVDGRKAP